MKQALRITAALAGLTLAAAPLCGFPASAVSLLSAEFETTNDSFSGRGGASVQWTSDKAYQGVCSLFVSGRDAVWQGAVRSADGLLKAGNTYKLSAAVLQDSGEAAEMKFSLEYTDANGKTAYDQIDLQTAESGAWTVLSNDAYTVPEGATGLSVYVETTKSLTDFYLDSVTAEGAPAVIKTGDANGDLTVSAADAVALARFLSRKSDSVEAGADFDKDGAVNAVDLSLLKNFLLFPPVPDTPQVSGDWDNYTETASPAMLQVYQDGLYRVGNTARIREKIAKAQAGQNRLYRRLDHGRRLCDLRVEALCQSFV